MAPIRCRNYDDAGAMIGNGCSQGGQCVFVHPSDPRWRSAMRSGRGRGGNFGGRGRGRGASSQGSFGTGANAPMNTSNSHWGASSSGQAAKTTADIWAGFGGGSPTSPTPPTTSTAWGAPPSAPSNATAGSSKSANAFNSWGDTSGGATETDNTLSGWGAKTSSGWGEATGVSGEGGEWDDPSRGWGSDSWGANDTNTEAMAVETPPSVPSLGTVQLPPASMPDAFSPVTPSSFRASTSGWGTSRQSEEAFMPPATPTTPANPIRADSSERMSVDPSSATGAGRRSRERGVSEAASTSRRASKTVPHAVRERREAVHEHLKRLQRAVHLKIQLEECEAQLKRWKRTQESQQYGHAGRAARNILEDKRREYDERRNSLEQRLKQEIANLAELPELAAYVKDLDPHSGMAEVASYAEEARQWKEVVAPLTEELVKKETVATVTRSSMEADFVPPTLQPLYARISEVDSRLDDMGEAFQHLATLDVDPLFNSRMQERSDDLTAAATRAVMHAQDADMQEPLAKITSQKRTLDQKLDAQAEQVAVLINAKDAVLVELAELHREQEKLEEAFAKRTAAVEEQRKLFEDMSRGFSELQVQVQTLQERDAAAHSGYSLQELQTECKPHIEQIVHDEIGPVLVNFASSVSQGIEAYQKETVVTVFRAFEREQ
ncbi:hypothetical protein FA95DRAFT_1602920 [Auriscalpium vulgare]|uniref:Uncharacterized protein n=1 Tax=Auriscalpium vulgare TaxID=40419 RepID=A0ACB8S3X9_9AGAM|nr:hypothetical protein FA95DRAFT_1602920 [Auriscalpium vulgare]